MATTQTTKTKAGNVPASETQQSRALTSGTTGIPRPQTGYPAGSVMSTPAQTTREERLEELSRLRTQQTDTPSDEERDRKQKEAIEALLKIKEDQKRKDKERRERRRKIHQLEKELNPSESRRSSSSDESDRTTSTKARSSTSASSAKRIGDLESKNQPLEQELQQLRLSQGLKVDNSLSQDRTPRSSHSKVERKTSQDRALDFLLE
ncbi:unnamed protein product [Tilletia laevis]|uniref:Uncharacterized protein n=1 Tax=Tilletia laevis TaxID=157183 RepID=A0A9N8M832_9BASI|nr:hypothetical protein CF336_g4738 [Tilletia laevis]KAE8194609.1 hypothetical protein CF335_g5303 [Tilletia laevis]CAD6915722.1 unnamed protein product [Tilletia caries]CAD6939120.1 unnamed protein product [Tilletia laevis]CAD6964181.1 unnamed protein product [Tilletia laevis]